MSFTPTQYVVGTEFGPEEATRLENALGGVLNGTNIPTEMVEAVQDIVGAMMKSGTGMSVVYDDGTGKVTITATNSGGGTGGATDSEIVRDTIASALRTQGLISVLVDDDGDTITIGSTATSNSTDAQLRDRSTHTGTQPSSTISDFTEAAQDAIGQLLRAGTNVALAYDDANNALSISSSASGGSGGTGTDPEVVRDTIGIALVGIAGVVVTVNDTADTITLSLSNVSQSQVSGLVAALNSKADKLMTVQRYDATTTKTSLLDPTVVSVHDITLKSSVCPIELPAPPTGLVATNIQILLVQDAVGGRQVTWSVAGGSSVAWLGSAPQPDSTLNSVTQIQLFSCEGKWFGQPVTAPSGGGGTGGAVVSVAGRTGPVVLTSSDVQLGNVTNDAQVKKAGDTMTGPLTLSGDPTNVLHAATRQWVLAQLSNLTGGAPAELDTFLEAYNRFIADENVANQKQPLDDDLTAIAGLATAAFGRSVLTKTNAADIRSLLQLGNVATENLLDGNGRIQTSYLRQVTQQLLAWRRSDTVAETVGRVGSAIQPGGALVSGVPYGTALRLVKGQQITGLRWWSGQNTGISSTTLLHSWGALLDVNGNVLRKTADDTTQITAGTAKKLAFADGPFTPSVDDNYYAMVVEVVSSGTAPALLAAGTNSTAIASALFTMQIGWSAAAIANAAGPETCPAQIVPTAGWTQTYFEAWN